MIRTYTEAEMLRIWKNKLGLFEAASGGVVTRQDGSNLDTYLISEIRAWYADVLRNADIELLPVENLAEETDSATYVDASTAELTFPERGIRPVGIKLGEWKREVARFYSPDSDMARLQRTPLLRASSLSPVVIIDKRKFIIYGVDVPQYQADASVLSSSSALESRAINFTPVIDVLNMVARPAEGTYVFDDSLLTSIP